VTAIIWSGSF